MTQWVNLAAHRRALIDFQNVCRWDRSSDWKSSTQQLYPSAFVPESADLLFAVLLVTHDDATYPTDNKQELGII